MRQSQSREPANLLREREKWFYSQREYPLGYIPAGARLKALHQLRQMLRAVKAMSPAVAAVAGGRASGQAANLANAIALSQSSWTLIGPRPTLPILGDPFTGFPNDSGRVTALAFDPRDTTDNTIYLGAAEGGLWVTTDGGQSWTPLTDSQSSLAVGSLALDPTSNPTTIYIGTGEQIEGFTVPTIGVDGYYGAGVLKSTDGGKTWTQDQTFTQAAGHGLYGSGPYIGSIAVAPDNNGVLLAAVQSTLGSTLPAGVWRSTDGGVTWTAVLAETPSFSGDAPAATSVVFDPAIPGQAFAALGDLFGNSANGIYVSTNDGSTWTEVGTDPDLGVTHMAVSPPTSTANGYLLVLAANASSFSSKLLGVFTVSIASSGTLGSLTQLFKPTTGPNFCDPQCFYDMAVGVNPANPKVIYLGGADQRPSASDDVLVLSTDGGSTWSADLDEGGGTLVNPSGQLHTDTHAIAFSPDGKVLAVGTDGGVWTTTDVGVSTNVTWNTLNGPLALTQFYPGISIFPGDPSRGLGGTQDNGTQEYVGNIEWRQISCGDGASTAVAPSGSVFYVACAAGEGVVEYSSTGPLLSIAPPCSGQSGGPLCDQPVDFVPPLVMDPEHPDTLYFGTYRLWQTTDGTVNPVDWSPLPSQPPVDFPSGDFITSIAVAPTDSKTIYIGTLLSGIPVTRTQGASWNGTGSGLPNRVVTDVVVDPNTSTTAYASFSGFSSCAACDRLGHVYETTNGGLSWTNISGNLPDTPVNVLVADPAISNTIYAATDVGVFANFDGGAVWTPVVSGLPNVAVLGLTIDSATRALWAGTHGRSMWALQLPQAPTASVSPASLRFPAQFLNTTSSPLPVTLSNTGAEALTITNISTSGGFAETNTCGASLVTSSSCTINVTFTPGATGTNTGALMIFDNLRSSPQTVPLTGSGTLPPVAAQPASLGFGAQAVSTSSGAQSVTLSNTGTGSATTLNITASGDFGQTTNCGTGLAAGGTCSINVSFTPSAAGSRSGTLTITGNISGGSSGTGPFDLLVSLYGYGTNGFVLPATGLRYVPLTPCRVADTRNTPNGPFSGPAIAAGTSRDFAIPSSTCGIPSTAAAYSLNVAVVPGGPLGYLTVWPTGQAQPLVATTNSVNGRVKSAAAIVPAGANGEISVYASNATNVVLDINGYFLPATVNPGALSFYPLTPCRVVDTRNATGPLGGPSLAGGQFRSFPILSSACGIPSTAQAYSLNFAAVPKVPLGFLTAWAAGQSQPLVATLNAVTGTVTANAAIVPVGTSGAIDVFASNDTDLVIDINGYFAPPGSGGLSFYVLSPCRVLDSRLPAGSQPFNGTINVNVTASPCGVPAPAQAFVFNATVVPPGALGYLTMWPQGTTQPLVATLNAVDGAVTNNLAIVPTNNGSISVFTSNPTYLVLDISGYFGP